MGAVSLTTLVRARLRAPSAGDPRVTNCEALAAKVVELARAGDRTMIARVRRRTGIDPTTSDLTDANLGALLVARLGIAASR
jgi:hypothetical protein